MACPENKARTRHLAAVSAEPAQPSSYLNLGSEIMGGGGGGELNAFQTPPDCLTAGPAGRVELAAALASPTPRTRPGGYLWPAGKYSVRAIDGKTGRLAGEFGSYGDVACQGQGSRFPHTELPYGTIAAFSVWQDRLFAVDVLNRRIVKCRIQYGSGKR